MRQNIVVKQADLKDCGACSLLSVIKYYGGYIPLETIRLDTCTTRIGTTAFHIINAAKKYGFDAVGLKVEEEKLSELILPSIAHIQVENKYNHFVVIYKFNKEKNLITIMDPAKGMRTLDFNVFSQTWSKVIISLYPKVKLPVAKKESILTLFLRLIPDEKELLLKLIATSIIFTFISLILSFYFKIALHDISFNNIKSLNLLIVLFLSLAIIKVMLNAAKEYYENYLNKNIDVKIMVPFLKHLLFLPLNVINNRTTGEIVTRVGEINNIKDLFSKVFVTIFLELLLGIGAAIILFSINKILFLLLLIIVVVYIGIGLLFSPIVYKKVADNIEYETNFNNEVIEKVDSFVTLKSIHKFDMIKKQIENKYCNYLLSTFRLSSFINKKNMVENFINEVGLCFITSIGCYLILKNKLALIDLITFNSILVYMINPIKNIVSLLPKINYLKASFKKISEFNSLEEEKLENYNEKFLSGDLEIDNLSFTYDNYHYICRDFNLFIKKGEKVMFRGSSGCGKSTICKLLYRLYDYKEGSIKIDNVNILDYHLNTIRNNITYLSQNEDIFTDTIYNNIVLDENVSTKKFKMISSLCHLEEIVCNKALRYETYIGNNINNLSGGEKQRILLARALLKKSSIIILDESLNQVQASLEKEIISNICTTFKDKIIIYVSHRNLDDVFNRIVDFDNIKYESIL